MARSPGFGLLISEIELICSDGDGTLWNTEEALFQVHSEMVAERGATLTLEDYMAITGTGALAAAQAVIARFGFKEDPEAYRAERSRRMHARMSTIAPMPGAEQFLEKVAKSGKPLALVSSASSTHVATLLDLLDFRRYFRLLVTADDPQLAGRLKPDPEPYLIAARHFGAAPHRCLAFEDTVSGATSAYRAGMIVVAAPHRLSPREKFTFDVAHHVIPEGSTIGDFEMDDIRHLLPQ